MTQIKFWYQSQDRQTKTAIRSQVVALWNVTIQSFYSYLNGGAPKLLINHLSEVSKIDKSQIYKNK
jgi:hypothetical protein